MRLLIDMNLTPRWVQTLAAAGHEAVHWSTVGPANAPDSAVCDYAREHQFVIVTSDLDFPQILAHSAGAKPSVILLRGEPLVPESRSLSFLRAVEGCSEELSAGAVLSLDWSGRPRARLLPLKR